MSQPNAPVDPGRPAAAPVLYRRPRPLDSTADQGLSLRQTADYRFAHDTNSVLLGASEFAAASGSYPIVFTSREPYVAVGVLGFEENQNLFVTADGQWRQGHYIPAYVRRYPFICFERADGSGMVLGVDAASDLLIQSAERPLFDAGGPTQLVRDALGFCNEFNRQTAASAAFVGALRGSGLLVANAAQVTLRSGRQVALRDFLVIDEARFNALSDAVFLDWRRRGWLPLVYAHLFSMNNWRRLGDLAATTA